MRARAFESLPSETVDPFQNLLMTWVVRPKETYFEVDVVIQKLKFHAELMNVVERIAAQFYPEVADQNQSIENVEDHEL